MATARDRYESSSYYESRDKGRAEHAAQDIADDASTTPAEANAGLPPWQGVYDPSEWSKHD